MHLNKSPCLFHISYCWWIPLVYFSPLSLTTIVVKQGKQQKQVITWPWTMATIMSMFFHWQIPSTTNSRRCLYSKIRGGYVCMCLKLSTEQCGVVKSCSCRSASWLQCAQFKRRNRDTGHWLADRQVQWDLYISTSPAHFNPDRHRARAGHFPSKLKVVKQLLSAIADSKEAAC